MLTDDVVVIAKNELAVVTTLKEIPSEKLKIILTSLSNVIQKLRLSNLHRVTYQALLFAC